MASYGRLRPAARCRRARREAVCTFVDVSERGRAVSASRSGAHTRAETESPPPPILLCAGQMAVEVSESRLVHGGPIDAFMRVPPPFADARRPRRRGLRFYPAAMTEMRSVGTLGDLLASRRQRRFVGRASEVELFRVALESPEPPFLLLHIHGPPGIGKTSLLDVYAGLAADAGATVVRLDGRELVPSPQAVLEALGEVLEVPAGDGAIAGPPDGGRLVVLCDTYERLAPLDDWVRTRLLPRLPATALTVVAGRAAPGSAWRADPAWRELLRVVSLRNLSPDDSRQYLHACGVDPARHDQLVESAHGHPLGLSLLADVSFVAARRWPIRSPRIWWAPCCGGSSRSSPAACIAAPWRCARSPG